MSGTKPLSAMAWARSRVASPNNDQVRTSRSAIAFEASAPVLGPESEHFAPDSGPRTGERWFTYPAIRGAGGDGATGGRGVRVPRLPPVLDRCRGVQHRHLDAERHRPVRA